MTTRQAIAPRPDIEAPTGAATWHFLDWDTRQFGFPAARLELLNAFGSYTEARARKEELLAAVLEECRTARIRHLSARVDTGDLTSIHALEKAGFELIDGIQTFRLSLYGTCHPQPTGTRLFGPGDLPEILEIGRTAFVFDRFHSDPALTTATADQVNESWTRNCCEGGSADAVIVAEDSGHVASYVTCKVDREAGEGTIVLVATADWARGKGAARRASAAALRWFDGQGVKSVEVGTQLRNIPAGRLYESLGFRLVRTSLTFRKIL